MKNKRVKQMMTDKYKGYWFEFRSGWKLMVHGGYLGSFLVSVDLNKTVSLTADQLKRK